MELKNDFLKELKAEIELLYNLGKKIELSGTHINNTEYIHGESLEADRYIVETDRFEYPFKYYHCQILKHHIEIRKARKNFEIHSFNFTPEYEKIKKEYPEVNFIQKTYGGNIHIITKCEDFQTATEIYQEEVMELVYYIKAKKENLLIW